jgi:hypothetical protein
MEAVAVILTLASLAAALIGLVSVVVPLRFLRIEDRKTGGLVLGAGLAGLVVASLFAPPAESPPGDAGGLAVADLGSTTTASELSTTSTTAASTTTLPPTAVVPLAPSTTTSSGVPEETVTVTRTSTG